MSKRTVLAWITWLAMLCPQSALAQLAPTGSHYAGRSSDTGHSGPSDSGGYAASIPLDLPPVRGGLPIPVQIVSGTRGFGAAGVGWDVPLSFVQEDASYARRRPAMAPDAVLSPRTRITVSLPGRRVEMVKQGTQWIGRYAADLIMRAENDTWKLFDGNGLTYTFTQDSRLTGTGGVGAGGLWLLTSIKGPGNSEVQLTYAIGAITLPHSSLPGISIDLTQVSYNRHPAQGCFKHDVTLGYALPLNPKFQSFSILGERVLVRDHRLAVVDVMSRSSCGSLPQRLRRYAFSYEDDPDTQQERLASVTMSGRQGTPEAYVSLPVAAYTYGSATSGGISGGTVFRFQSSSPLTVNLPLGANVIADTVKDTTSVFHAPIPGSTRSYVTQNLLIDMTGDGRPDLVFEQNGKLWISRNMPGPAGTPTLGIPAPLDDNVFIGTPYLEARSSEVDRFGNQSQFSKNREYVWRQLIDVNGDGRMDMIDASQEPKEWMIYVNTPSSSTASGIQFVRRKVSIETLYNRFDALKLEVASGYLPLSRRFTGRDYLEWMCWAWDDNLDVWVRDLDGVDNEQGCGTGGQPAPTLPGPNPEKTYVEWEVKDVNGDSYPDVLFNSSPVVFRSEPPLPPGGFGGHHLGVAHVKLRPLADDNRVLAVLNVGGLAMANTTSTAAPPYPFSAPTILERYSSCGVGLWSAGDDGYIERQGASCGFVEVNGDGIVDRVIDVNAKLGTGSGYTESIKLPWSLVQQSTHPTKCTEEVDPHATWSVATQLSTLRDVTGDGIPDFVRQKRDDPYQYEVYVGTTAGFTGEGVGTGHPYFGLPIDIEGTFAISHVDERCDGNLSRTIKGLYDLDADGKPEYVKLGKYAPWHLEVFPLVGGSTWGNPESGRIIETNNGYGAATTISYRSAKQDTLTAHHVPYPEIVVSRIETNGKLGLGGTVAAKQYAYGGIELFYDSALDAFRPTGYQRQIVLTTTSGAHNRYQATARITDRYALDQVTPGSLYFMTDRQRFGRYLRAGRVRDVSLLAGTIGTDVWSLLGVDITSDSRLIAGQHHTVDTANTRLFTDTTSTGPDPCFEITFPYDYDTSKQYNSGRYNACAARGFVNTGFASTWRGTAPPPSPNSVEVYFSVIDVDNFGRITTAKYHNDASRIDDDYCVETTYPTPIGTTARVLTAPASQKVTSCSVPGRPSLVYAEEAWQYDKLMHGLISRGLVTGHTVYRHATDTGAYISTVREYDVTYDVSGNPIKVEAAREDGATRVTTVQYDGFGLAPSRRTVAGTNVPALDVWMTFDPVSDELVGTLDANEKILGTTYDGFGRPILETIDSDGVEGVLVARSYLGFDGDPKGRRVEVKRFTDPVPQSQIASEPGRVTTTFLDELGRERKSEVALGADYANDTMIVGARMYDPLGRIVFEADPYPASQDPNTAYGTTRWFERDGSLAVAIRGHGFQPYTITPDPSVERYPTVFRHTFANRQEKVMTQSADALTPGSAQLGVTREMVRTAVGRTLTASTWQNGQRLEHAAFAYDPLGQQTKMLRYQSPSGPSNPVEWSWQFDSMGQILAVREPSVALQERFYSDFGELVKIVWTPAFPEPGYSIVKTYDALGRLIRSEEQNAGSTDPATVSEFSYDVPAQAKIINPTRVLGRLASASAPTGYVAFSYDQLGNVNARSYIDTDGNAYVEQHGFHADGSQAWLELQLPDNNYQPERVDYAYDTAGRLRWMWYSDGWNTQELYNASKIDAWGRLRSAMFGKATEYAAYYDELGRRLPKEVKVQSALGKRAVMFTEFDPLGRELSRDEDTAGFAGSQYAAYDPLGRLRSFSRTQSGMTTAQWSFNYDPIGNVRNLNDQLGTADAQMSYLTTDRDRICRIGYGGMFGMGCNVEYDSVGNIIREPTRAGYNELQYFNSGDVRSIKNQAGVTAEFRYDSFGQLQELDVTSGSTVLRSDRHYGSFITQRTRTGPGGGVSYLSRQFPGPGLVASRRGPKGPWIYQFTEPRGTRFTTEHDGKFVQDVDYTPFGEASSDGAQPGSLEYSSEQWNQGNALEAFGLVHLGARLYDPAIGRFLSRDPLIIPRTATTTNPYAFAFNDPFNFSDPSGMDGCAENPDCAANIAASAAAIGALIYTLSGGGGSSALPEGADPIQQKAYYTAYADRLDELKAYAWQGVQEELAPADVLFDALEIGARGLGGNGAGFAINALRGSYAESYIATRGWSIEKQIAFVGLNAPVAGNFFTAGAELREEHYQAAGLHMLAGAAEIVLSEVGVRLAGRGTPTISSGSHMAGGSGKLLGKLRKIGPKRWRSSGGLEFGPDPAFGNRVKHVMAHTVPDPSKTVHSVFSVPRNQVLGLVDEAWAMRGSAVPGDPGAFVVNMGRTIGTAGETSIRIVVRPGTSSVITAYPWP